jgi:hypothetical protein
MCTQPSHAAGASGTCCTPPGLTLVQLHAYYGKENAAQAAAEVQVIMLSQTFVEADATGAALFRHASDQWRSRNMFAMR